MMMFLQGSLGNAKNSQPNFFGCSAASGENTTVSTIRLRDDITLPNENTPLGSSGTVPGDRHPANAAFELGSSRFAVVLLGSFVRYPADNSSKPCRHFAGVFQTALSAALARHCV